MPAYQELSVERSTHGSGSLVLPIATSYSSTAWTQRHHVKDSELWSRRRRKWLGTSWSPGTRLAPCSGHGNSPWSWGYWDLSSSCLVNAVSVLPSSLFDREHRWSFVVCKLSAVFSGLLWDIWRKGGGGEGEAVVLFKVVPPKLVLHLDADIRTQKDASCCVWSFFVKIFVLGYDQGWCMDLNAYKSSLATLFCRLS